jgi:HNH endonuclease/NUMOD3 motif
MPNQHHLARYNNFISALKGQVVEGYSEKHHIVPRSHGGSNKKDNLIALTPRQHFIAHRMLWKAYGGSMARAYFMMSATGKYGKIGSKTYAMAREEYSKQVVIQMTGKPAQSKFDAEHRAKLSQAKLGTKVSDATKAKISAFQTGRKASEETKKKISEAKQGISTRGTGWQQSQETRNKIALSNADRPLLSCRGCKNTFKLHGGVKRWHLENCKGTQI